ncbi:hypothetical protein C8Q79DRAFT_946533 [Trametes meyenii]|nr:hypothetical protein C8Q79DRAFT_946533 [Trametes meyenii]
MVNVAIGMVLVADGTLTTLLIAVLRRRRTGFQSTEAMLNLLVAYTINTGLLTGTLTSISFFMGVFYPHTLIADGMNMCIAKLYANSLLAALNSRHSAKNHGQNRSAVGLSRSEGPTSGVGFHSTGERFTVGTLHDQGPTTSHEVIDIKRRDAVDDIPAEDLEEAAGACYELRELSHPTRAKFPVLQ